MPENGLSDKNGEKAMGKINRIEVLQKQMREKGIEAALIENRRPGVSGLCRYLGRQYADHSGGSSTVGGFPLL